MLTEAYRLPSFLALLPEKPGGEINPHFKDVESEFNAWVEKKLSARLAEEIYESDIPVLVSLGYPSASHEHSMGALNYLTMAFIADDLSERISSKQFAAFLRLGIRILRGGGNDQNPLTEMVGSELIFSIKTTVGSFHWPQFIDINEKTAKQAVQEARELEVNAALDIQSYIIKRRWTVGAYSCFVFCRSIRSLYISDDVLANPIIREMEDAAADMIVISNDILSFKKESAGGTAFHNLLTVMKRVPETAHLDFQKRLDYAGELFKAALERFDECRRNLPSFNPEMDRYLVLYADGVLDFVVGNVQWNHVCRRYGVFANEEDRRDNVLRLPSQWLPRKWDTFLTIFGFALLLFYTFFYYTE